MFNPRLSFIAIRRPDVEVLAFGEIGRTYEIAPDRWNLEPGLLTAWRTDGSRATLLDYGSRATCMQAILADAEAAA